MKIINHLKPLVYLDLCCKINFIAIRKNIKIRKRINKKPNKTIEQTTKLAM